VNNSSQNNSHNNSKKRASNLKSLTFYSYDYIDNPWCGGGGAYRDREVLLQQRHRWNSVTLIVGNFPGFKEEVLSGIHIKCLGYKTTHLISRLSFSFLANLHIIRNRSNVIGNAVSIHAPIFSGLLFPKRFYGVVHHLIEKQSFQKFGIIGCIPYLSEKLIFSRIKNVISSNRAVYNKIKLMNPAANILVSANGFDTTG